MPTYEYACKDCGSHLEVVQSFTDDALTECPSCNGSLRKVFGSVGISFKGSGFYKNDSRPPAKSKSSAGTSSDPAPAAESSGSSESKPAESTSVETKPTESKPAPASDKAAS